MIILDHIEEGAGPSTETSNRADIQSKGVGSGGGHHPTKDERRIQAIKAAFLEKGMTVDDEFAAKISGQVVDAEDGIVHTIKKALQHPEKVYTKANRLILEHAILTAIVGAIAAVGIERVINGDIKLPPINLSGLPPMSPIPDTPRYDTPFERTNPQSPFNPASPTSPLNPANPESPFNPNPRYPRVIVHND